MLWRLTFMWFHTSVLTHFRPQSTSKSINAVKVKVLTPKILNCVWNITGAFKKQFKWTPLTLYFAYSVFFFRKYQGFAKLLKLWSNNMWTFGFFCVKDNVKIAETAGRETHWTGKNGRRKERPILSSVSSRGWNDDDITFSQKQFNRHKVRT